MEFTHILAPTDMSEASLPAIEAAVAIAQRFEAKITLLHVVIAAASKENVDWKDATKMWLGLADWEEIQDEKQALEAIADKKVPDCLESRVHVLYGDAADEIASVVKQTGVDLIVMGTHGRTGWRRVVHGSVTEQVLRASVCPVLCIPRLDAGK